MTITHIFKGLHVRVLDDPSGKELGRGEIMKIDDVNGQLLLEDGNWYPSAFTEMLPLAPLKGSTDAEGIKLDGDKPRFDLLPPEALLEVVKGMTHGAEKYSAHNWRKGMKFSRLYAALQRHAQEFHKGNDIDVIDANTGRCQHHMAAVVFNALAIIQLQLEGRTDLDDRHKGPLYGKH